MDKSLKRIVIGLAVTLALCGGALVAHFDSGGRLSYTEPAGNPSVSQADFTLVAASERAPPEAFSFHDGEGRALAAADLAGKVVLVNLWATWCPPCVAEMGALDRLQGRLGGPDFQVTAISLDRGGAEVAGRWYGRNNIAHLGLYTADSGQFQGAMLPTSILLDARGRVAWQGMGQREWDGAEAEAMIRAVMAEADG
jgi:Thiol-disulfide isomerase and thioredoxins